MGCIAPLIENKENDKVLEFLRNNKFFSLLAEIETTIKEGTPDGRTQIIENMRNFCAKMTKLGYAERCNLKELDSKLKDIATELSTSDHITEEKIPHTWIINQ